MKSWKRVLCVKYGIKQHLVQPSNKGKTSIDVIKSLYHVDVLTLLSTTNKLVPVAPTLSNCPAAIAIAKNF
jgi:hypothetical protein